MRYIKLFEDLDENTPLKKYIVWKNNHNKEYRIFLLDKIEEVEIKNIGLKTRYWINIKYETRNDKLLPMNPFDEMYFYSEHIKDHILYTSDSIEECIEYLKIKLDTDKYNL